VLHRARPFRSTAIPKTPTYRSRKDYPDKAIVTLTDSATGKRRDDWLGRLNSRESREMYHRVIAAWEANQRRLPNDHLRTEEAARQPANHDGPDQVLVKHISGR